MYHTGGLCLLAGFAQQSFVPPLLQEYGLTIKLRERRPSVCWGRTHHRRLGHGRTPLIAVVKGCRSSTFDVYFCSIDEPTGITFGDPHGRSHRGSCSQVWRDAELWACPYSDCSACGMDNS